MLTKKQNPFNQIVLYLATICISKLLALSFNENDHITSHLSQNVSH